MKIRVAGIVKESIVDGPGIRYVIFAQGCKHRCPGCHNPHTHSFDKGTLMEVDTILEEIKENPLLDGITLSGGDPLEQASGFTILAQKVKEMHLNVMVYTGYTYEEIRTNTQDNPHWGDLLALTDLLVDGRFLLEKKEPLLKFRGSKNQRIIDVKETRFSQEVIVAKL